MPSGCSGTLWRTLEIDPNTEKAFGWHCAIPRKRGGESAEDCELERMAALPGSWRAQMWLARAALSSLDFEKAFVLYRQGVNHAEWPVQVDLLMQMTGDLGDCGQLAELLKLAEPELSSPSKFHLLFGWANVLQSVTLWTVTPGRITIRQNWANWSEAFYSLFGAWARSPLTRCARN